jgi:hypothetical protein
LWFIYFFFYKFHYLDFSICCNSYSGIFDDAEERSFYEDLPDLKALLPAVLFSGGSGANDTDASTGNAEQGSEGVTEGDKSASQPATDSLKLADTEKDDDVKVRSLCNVFLLLLLLS